ncbi:unnamed protein product [Zymoseptoria tritici ST99CH_1A5]|uniref:Serine/threonine-protein phosphatase 2A activator n=1 Tax=Zymoseptoria tritici ST99CH_1A5 TaxID=1276529 RepID=A0A1Y6L5B7_ZYMTR|nr:unnamed protein product [Zymoseptoria tritici ST99CH_1A5]
MCAQTSQLAPDSIPRLQNISQHEFSTPVKKINDGDDLNFFLSSLAYRNLMQWLLQLTRSMFPTKEADGKSISTSTLDSPPSLSRNVLRLQQMLSSLTDLIQRAPPDTGPRRFGNVAFREWFRIAEEDAASLLDEYLDGGQLSDPAKDTPQRTALRDELKVYLVGSFGSAQRLDYGTGHELSFLAFLGSLWKMGLFEDGEEQSIVVGIIQPYLTLMRRLILTYTLEPAGSHGVWGLDDHSFVPYIFGSAQLGPAITSTSPIPTEGSLSTAPSPASVADKTLVRDYASSNMYFSAIQFIHDVKRGPFWEHSPVLYDISGIKDGWGKINKGMLKMYAAEVLGKFPVVQHFPFGSLWRWERDPEASQLGEGSIHAMQQPKSKDVPPPPMPTSSVGTAAPWAKQGTQMGTSIPQMQASTGLPSTRAPWASNTGGVGGRGPAAPSANMPAPGQRRSHPSTDMNAKR